jgi:CDP-6-deoxy-D-xylo-4-hexulose-3-dehydrase
MVQNKAEHLREEILEKVKEYYEVSLKQDDTFIPGKSKVNYGGRFFDEKEVLNLVDSSLDFWLTYGRFSKEFEKKFANFLGVRYALTVNSGSSANLLAFYALTSPLLKERMVKRGDEIITVAAGFPTTVAPIIQYGAIPVFVDVELDTHNIDVNEMKKALSKKTKAVMVAHTLGNPFNIKEVKEFCNKNNLWLIEDNCDSLGSKYLSESTWSLSPKPQALSLQYTGTFGDIGTSSFYPPHHITMGEGGAVYTNNPLLKKIMLSMRDWGRDCWCDSGLDDTCGCRFDGQFGKLPKGYDHKYVYSHFGFNLKITDMQAAVGCAQLDKLEYVIKRRQENFQYLCNELKKFEDIFVLPKATSNSEPSWFGFLIVLKDNLSFSRNDLVEYLEKNLIQTRNLFAGNIIKHPCFEHLTEGVDYKVIGNLKNTDKIMNDAFWIGVYPGMTEEKLEYMVEKIEEFITKKG